MGVREDGQVKAGRQAAGRQAKADRQKRAGKSGQEKRHACVHNACVQAGRQACRQSGQAKAGRQKQAGRGRRGEMTA